MRLLCIICRRFARFPLFNEPVFYKFFDDLVEHCKNRNTDKHAEQSPKAAGDGDRDDNQKGIDANLFAEDFWADDVAVELLDDQRAAAQQ